MYKYLLALPTTAIGTKTIGDYSECVINNQIVECPEAFGEFFLAFFVIIFAVSIALTVLMIASYWKIFTKAGQPGWASLVPIYNIVVILRIIQKPWWWIFLFFIPVINIFIAILTIYKLARAFGKGAGFTIGLIFLGPIFLPILAFGNSKYQPEEGEFQSVPPQPSEPTAQPTNNQNTPPNMPPPIS